jgi:hypothetical protein
MLALGAGITLSRHIEVPVSGGCVELVQDFSGDAPGKLECLKLSSSPWHGTTMGEVSLALPGSRAILEYCTLGQYEYCHVSPIPISEDKYIFTGSTG